MPIQSWATFEKWVARENITVPPHFYDALLPVKDDDARVREVGTKLVGEMCKKLLAEPGAISGLHIYTLNLQVGARMLLEEVGLGPSVPDVSPMPWTPVSATLFSAPGVRRAHKLIRLGSYHSHLRRTDGLSRSDRSSGRTDRSRTCLEPRTGTSSRTDDGETRDHPPTESSTVTSSPSSSCPRRRPTICGASQRRSRTSARSSQSSA